MTKKIGLGLVALVAVAASVVGLSAFEAHVINVTAKIENALSVTTDKLNFGTVFPQEHLEQPLAITLSESFIREDRVDDVEYIIRQKPKCAVTTDDGDTLVGPTWTGHVVPTPDDPATTGVDESNAGTAYTIDCEADKPKDLPQGVTYGLLPSLCEYVSKDGGDEDGLSPENDDTTPSFHKPFEVVGGVVNWLDTDGKLTKILQDTVDNWIIDLAVPCFGDHCAQDWADFVHGINSDPDVNPDDYVQDIDNEHKIFGCNLWIEVTEVSERPVGDTNPT